MPGNFVTTSMNAFTIKDLENLSGIKAHTIRIWEQRYSLLRPQRTETNIRFYSGDQLQKILNVALLNKYGFKISHIDRMTESEMNEKILSLSQAEAQQEWVVNELIRHMVHVDMMAFEKVVDGYIRTKGIEKTILQVLFPFLERIGILWQTNHINPAQEHLVTNLIRQKLIVGIDAARSPVQQQQSALLFLPEGEHHELGLLFVSYLLKSKGITVYYLGANMPLKDVGYVAALKNPDFLYVHLTSVSQYFSFERFLVHAHKQIPGRKIVVSGAVTHQYKKKIPEGFSCLKSLAEVVKYIASIS